ncbi:MAG: chloride channel protein [Candidatus Bathyarchaeia archaeon]|jgi:CIC family chloride channel protein
MSKYSDGAQYYLLVAVVGLIAASVSIGFYLLYQQIWSVTQQALEYSILIIVPLSFLAIGLPYIIVNRFAKTKTTGSGTHSVLEAYHLTNGEISLKDTIVKPIAGMLTIGLGGSAGPEGPSLLAGGGVASALSKRFHMPADVRRRLFVAGAAAGLAATFRTPLTGILFALEIPYKNDLDRETFIEAVVSSVPAYLLSITVLGSEPLFGITLNATISWMEIALSLLLGLICGLYAILFTKLFSWTGTLALKIKQKYGTKTVITTAALLLSLSGAVSLYTIGIGLTFTSAIIQTTSLSLALLVTVVVLKTFMTAFTLNFGGSGGLFFPSIVIGAGIGCIFAQVFNANYPVMFIAVGMAALLGGTHKILLTPIAFIMETLGGLFAIPALLANGVSYLVSGRYSFYSLQPRTRLKAEELALERFFVKAEKQAPEKLQITFASDVMTRNPVSIRKGASVKEALELFEGTKFRVFPVVDDANHVVGAINLEDLGYVDVYRQTMSISDTVMHKPTLIQPQTNLKNMVQVMMEKQQDHIFVIDQDLKLIGVISGIDVNKKMIELIST